MLGVQTSMSVLSAGKSVFLKARVSVSIVVSVRAVLSVMKVLKADHTIEEASTLRSPGIVQGRVMETQEFIYL